MINSIRFEVAYEDETTHVVTADQRDMAVFEAIEKRSTAAGYEDTPTILYRILAWAALKRTGQIDAKTTREAWDAIAVQVRVVPKEDTDESGDQVRPGNPEATEGGRSSSRSSRARRSGTS